MKCKVVWKSTNTKQESKILYDKFKKEHPDWYLISGGVKVDTSYKDKRIIR